MGSEGFSRFPSPYSLVGSDGFVPMSIIYIHIHIYIYMTVILVLAIWRAAAVVTDTWRSRIHGCAAAVVSDSIYGCNYQEMGRRGGGHGERGAGRETERTRYLYTYRTSNISG